MVLRRFGDVAAARTHSSRDGIVSAKQMKFFFDAARTRLLTNLRDRLPRVVFHFGSLLSTRILGMLCRLCRAHHPHGSGLSSSGSVSAGTNILNRLQLTVSLLSLPHWTNTDECEISASNCLPATLFFALSLLFVAPGVCATAPALSKMSGVSSARFCRSAATRLFFLFIVLGDAAETSPSHVYFPSTWSQNTQLRDFNSKVVDVPILSSTPQLCASRRSVLRSASSGKS